MFLKSRAKKMTPKCKHYISLIKLAGSIISWWYNKEEPVYKVMENLRISMKQKKYFIFFLF